MSIINLFTANTTIIDSPYYPDSSVLTGQIGPIGYTGSVGLAGNTGPTGITGPTGSLRNSIVGPTGTGYVIVGNTGSSPITYSYNTSVSINSAGLSLNNETNNTILNASNTTNGILMLSNSMTGPTGMVYDTEYNQITTTRSAFQKNITNLLTGSNYRYRCSALSANSQYIVVGGSTNNAYIWLSNDYGNTFTGIQLVQNQSIDYIDISDDGKYILAATVLKVYLSSNYGVTFSDISDISIYPIVYSAAGYKGVALSANGQYQMITTGILDYNKISTNYGNTGSWVNENGGLNNNCIYPAIKSGNTFYYIISNTSPYNLYMYYSINGNTGSYDPFTTTNTNELSSISSSSDLKYIIITTNKNIYVCNTGDINPLIFNNIVTNLPVPSGAGLWNNASISSSGETQVITPDQGNTMYISFDYGTTWTPHSYNLYDYSINFQDNNGIIIVGDPDDPVTNNIYLSQLTIGIGDILNNNNNAKNYSINNLSSLSFSNTSLLNTTITAGITGGTMIVSNNITGATGMIYDTFFNPFIPNYQMASFYGTSSNINSNIASIVGWKSNLNNIYGSVNFITCSGGNFTNITNTNLILQISGSIVWDSVQYIIQGQGAQIVNVTPGTVREVWISILNDTSRYGYDSISANNYKTVNNFSTIIVLGASKSFSIYANHNDFSANNNTIIITSPTDAGQNTQYISRLDIIRLA
jgi:hypothetical protein